MKGFDLILERIKADPRKVTLRLRYLALVADLKDLTQKAQAVLQLAEFYSLSFPREALQMSYLVCRYDPKNQKALQIIIDVLESQKKTLQARFMREYKAKLAQEKNLSGHEFFGDIVKSGLFNPQEDESATFNPGEEFLSDHLTGEFSSANESKLISLLSIEKPFVAKKDQPALQENNEVSGDQRKLTILDPVLDPALTLTSFSGDSRSSASQPDFKDFSSSLSSPSRSSSSSDSSSALMPPSSLVPPSTLMPPSSSSRLHPSSSSQALGAESSFIQKKDENSKGQRGGSYIQEEASKSFKSEISAHSSSSLPAHLSSDRLFEGAESKSGLEASSITSSRVDDVTVEIRAPMGGFLTPDDVTQHVSKEPLRPIDIDLSPTEFTPPGKFFSQDMGSEITTIGQGLELQELGLEESLDGGFENQEQVDRTSLSLDFAEAPGSQPVTQSKMPFLERNNVSPSQKELLREDILEKEDLNGTVLHDDIVKQEFLKGENLPGDDLPHEFRRKEVLPQESTGQELRSHGSTEGPSSGRAPLTEVGVQAEEAQRLEAGPSSSKAPPSFQGMNRESSSDLSKTAGLEPFAKLLYGNFLQQGDWQAAEELLQRLLGSSGEPARKAPEEQSPWGEAKRPFMDPEAFSFFLLENLRDHMHPHEALRRYLTAEQRHRLFSYFVKSPALGRELLKIDVYMSVGASLEAVQLLRDYVEQGEVSLQSLVLRARILWQTLGWQAFVWHEQSGREDLRKILRERPSQRPSQELL